MSWMQPEQVPGQLHKNDNQKSNIVFGEGAPAQPQQQRRPNPQGQSNITFDPACNVEHQPRQHNHDQIAQSFQPQAPQQQNARQQQQNQFNPAAPPQQQAKHQGVDRQKTNFSLANDDTNIAQLQADARNANANRAHGKQNQQSDQEFKGLQPIGK